MADKGAWIAPRDSKPKLRLYNSLTRRKVLLPRLGGTAIERAKIDEPAHLRIRFGAESCVKAHG